MRERILLCKPKMSGRELDFIMPALAEDWVVPMGPDVNAFEKELGVVIDAENVVALESGTSAIHLAPILCGVKPGDEDIVRNSEAVESPGPRNVAQFNEHEF